MKKKKFLVLDVETANDVNCPLVYDLGFAVCDKYGKIYEKQSMLIYEIYRGERELMNSCYYANKIPEYEEQIKRGETKIVRFFTAWKIIRDTMKKYNIDTIAAYNCNFDRNALNNTIRYLTKSEYRWFFPYNTKYMCIWHMACQVIYTQKTFQKWAKKIVLFPLLAISKLPQKLDIDTIQEIQTFKRNTKAYKMLLQNVVSWRSVSRNTKA